MKAKLSGIFSSHAFLWRWPFWENLAPPISTEKPQDKQQSRLDHSPESLHQKPIKMKRQRAITQMREKGKTPKSQLRNEGILSLQEKDFRLLMLKMMQDIRNKLEAKIDNLQETVSKEIQELKLKQKCKIQ